MGTPVIRNAAEGFRATATGIVRSDGLAVVVSDDGVVYLEQRGLRREAPVRVRGDLRGRRSRAAMLVLTARSVE